MRFWRPAQPDTFGCFKAMLHLPPHHCVRCDVGAGGGARSCGIVAERSSFLPLQVPPLDKTCCVCSGAGGGARTPKTPDFETGDFTICPRPRAVHKICSRASRAFRTFVKNWKCDIDCDNSCGIITDMVGRQRFELFAEPPINLTATVLQTADRKPPLIFRGCDTIVMCGSGFPCEKLYAGHMVRRKNFFASAVGIFILC